MFKVRPFARVLLALMGGSAFLAGEYPVQAEDVYQLAPVMVSAEKREEDLQKVPVSVTAITSQTVKDAGVKSIQDFSRMVPNMYTANWGMRGVSYVFMRGIGAVNNDPAIGFYVDDVSYFDSRVFDSGLFDIERIEVLRGPQGTLYGKNSLAGVINIVTKKPDNNFHFGAEQTIGNYAQVGTSAYLRAPLLSDKLFFSISGSRESRDGYAENTWLNNRVDDRQNWNGRAQLRWTPTDAVDVSFTVDGEKINDGVYPLTDKASAEDNPHKVRYNYDGSDKRDSLGGTLRASVDFPWFNVTSITSYRGYDDITSNDQDFTPWKLMRAKEDIRDRQFTQELRFSSPKDSKPLKWLGGAYLYHKRQEHRLDLFYDEDFAPYMGLPLPPGFTMKSRADADTFTNGVALFGQATYTLFDKLDLTAGLRYEYEKNSVDYKSAYKSNNTFIPPSMLGMNDARHDGNRIDEVLLPKFQIGYHWTDNFMTYAGVARGYRSGGFNTAFTDSSDLSFGPEYSWNYELGFKSVFFDNKLIFNGAAFYTDIDKQQVTKVLPNANTVIRNAGRSRSYGFELEGSAILPMGFRLDAGFGYTRSEYLQYSDQGVDYKGKTTPLAPEYTYNVALQHTLPVVQSFSWLDKQDSLNWVNRLEIQGVGDFYWNDANTLKQDAYGLINLRSGFETDNFSLTFWIKNLADTKYNAVAFMRDASTALVEVGAPRTFGMTFRMDF